MTALLLLLKMAVNGASDTVKKVFAAD